MIFKAVVTTPHMGHIILAGILRGLLIFMFNQVKHFFEFPQPQDTWSAEAKMEEVNINFAILVGRKGY